MSGEEDKNREASRSSYGTFQGVPTYPPPSYPHPPSQSPVTGFPKPSPPPGAAHHNLSVRQYAQGYQTVPVVDKALNELSLAEGRPVTERGLPCCGLGVSWFLFITGFLLGGITWYIGAFLLVCARVNPPEKPGYVACTLAAVLATIAIVFGLMGGREPWS